MNHEKKIEEIIENAEISAGVGLQGVGRLGKGTTRLFREGELDKLTEQCRNKPFINPKIMDMLSDKFEGGFRRGEMTLISAYSDRLHPAYIGIGAVVSHEEAMDKLEAAGKAFPSGYMWYRDEKTGREFPLPALASGKSTMFQSIVAGNEHLRNIYSHATVLSYEGESLTEFIGRNVVARKEAKAAKLSDDGIVIDDNAVYPKLTHFAFGNNPMSDHTLAHALGEPSTMIKRVIPDDAEIGVHGVGAFPNNVEVKIGPGYKLTDLHGGMGVIFPVLPPEEPKHGPVSYDVERFGQALRDGQAGKIPMITVDSVPDDLVVVKGAERRSKKPKKHGDKQSTDVVKVRPSGLLKAFMKKAGA